MKAMLLMGHGGPEMMKFGEAPDPKAGPGEVVVDIHVASVNGADPKVRRGNGRYKLDRFPHILGRDFSGVVSELGAGVTDFNVGDRRVRRDRRGTSKAPMPRRSPSRPRSSPRSRPRSATPRRRRSG